jgi:tRNA threonylcarbamoyl adenosine modification protein (Sua5/YciO/YrdC/YwlC family)
MAKIYTLHPQTPQARTVDLIQSALQDGAVMLYPTDTVYAIGCDLNAKSAIARVRQLKQLANDKPLTFLCPSLSNIASYAMVSDSAYRLMKHLIPGPYTFLLPATKQVPRLVMNPKRKTTGIRVPDSPICLALLTALDHPIISMSAPPDPEEDGIDPEIPSQACRLSRIELFDRFDKLVDVIIDDGAEPKTQVSTILDLTHDQPMVIRRGLGWEAIADWDVAEAS